jgi:hypothetical protein
MFEDARSMNIINTTDLVSAPLESCLLVDYRLSSRTRLREFIHSTQIFKRVHEPGSLTLGLEMVSDLRVETCIFGPSVRAEKIQDFIINTKASPGSKDCAFLVFQPRERREDVSGAHAVVEFPCMQPNFNVGIVRALAEANGGTLPESRRVNPVTGKPISLKATLARLDFSGRERQQGSMEGSGEGAQPQWTRQLIEAVVRCSHTLYGALLDVKPFNLRFRSDGEPSEFTVNTVRNIIDQTFVEFVDVPDMELFKEALQPLLFQWAKRATLQGRAAADFVLKRELLHCLRGS